MHLRTRRRVHTCACADVCMCRRAYLEALEPVYCAVQVMPDPVERAAEDVLDRMPHRMLHADDGAADPA